MIIIYSADWCAPCVTLKKYLDKKGLKYRIKDADDEKYAKELMKLTNRRLLPTTVINGTVVQGLNWGALSRALEEK